ncbi:hypothetical protein CORC01_00546 [Colletotrichum orchidophilum]|uniref:Uncharacterized protein n=1 Tax=Colletotrichum orchidophilum TaxID=1209926 RepID=A0A1G4BSH0_9PEZI|nr:uncharacterized protein CORC01_00546 [Colletotrichum orchidophilum]OHF04207.1 hypothetical protein CORC01_00546 [Colletotrichum orchidophilum]
MDDHQPCSQSERTHNLARCGYLQITFIWLFSLSYQIAWTRVVAAYALEIMPHSLRVKAGVMSMIGFKGLVFLGSYTNPIARDNFIAAGHDWVLAIFYTTKNLTLEEVAKVFDGDEAKVARMDIEDVKYQLVEDGKSQSHVEVIVL